MSDREIVHVQVEITKMKGDKLFKRLTAIGISYENKPLRWGLCRGEKQFLKRLKEIIDSYESNN